MDVGVGVLTGVRVGVDLGVNVGVGVSTRLVGVLVGLGVTVQSGLTVSPIATIGANTSTTETAKMIHHFDFLILPPFRSLTTG